MTKNCITLKHSHFQGGLKHALVKMHLVQDNELNWVMMILKLGSLLRQYLRCCKKVVRSMTLDIILILATKTKIHILVTEECNSEMSTDFDPVVNASNITPKLIPKRSNL